MNKQAKYRLLRHLPGRRGRRYSRKLRALTVLDDFDDALRHSANKTCIDLGANIGQYTEKMAQRVKSVIALEPDPWAYARLKANVANLTNVRIENAAASTQNGTVPFWRHKDFHDDPYKHSISSSLVSYKSNIANSDQMIEVRSIDFVGYLLELNEDIGVIKMDIEGAEVDILEALLDTPKILSRIDYIFAETHERKLNDQIARVESLVDRTYHMTQPYFNLEWP